jgi:predicted unusual protein kinase regulating ubiquinone biosynthesis (AarF/ABC1/UbiB family)
MVDPRGPEDDAPSDEGDPQGREHRTTGRFGRFARLSSLTAGVAARHLTQAVVGAFQSDEAAEESKKKALEKSADRIVETLGDLKGAAMKVGQMLSTDPEVLPPELADKLTLLQRDAPPMEFGTVRDVVEQALDTSLGEAFAWFSEEPIGAASIGQVHRATTRDGQDVAVKVQYPGIADSVESDLKNLSSLLNLIRTTVPKERVEAYRLELTEVIKRESDYLHEADQLERFQTVLRGVEGIRAPLPVHDLTRRNVLTMQFCEGQRLSDYLVAADDDERTRVGTLVITAYIHMVHVHAALHADPHPGNFLVDDEGHVVFLDMGCVRDYELDFSEDLLSIVRHMWRGEGEEVQEAWRRLGFSDDGVDVDAVLDYLELILEPLLVDQVFDFGAWNIHEQGLKFVREHPSLMRFAPPREAIFYLRVLAGLRGLMAAGNVRINAHRIAKAWVEQHR